MDVGISPLREMPGHLAWCGMKQHSYRAILVCEVSEYVKTTEGSISSGANFADHAMDSRSMKFNDTLQDNVSTNRFTWIGFCYPDPTEAFELASIIWTKPAVRAGFCYRLRASAQYLVHRYRRPGRPHLESRRIQSVSEIIRVLYLVWSKSCHPLEKYDVFLDLMRAHGRLSTEISPYVFDLARFKWSLFFETAVLFHNKK